MLCSGKLPVAKKILHRRWGGVSKFFVKSFFGLKCRKNSLGNTSVLCFREIPRTKNSMDKRGGYQVFPTKVFCTTMPKTLARELFCVVFQTNSCREVDYGLERGVSISSVERFFVSECRKFRWGKFLCCVSEKFR